MCLGEACGFGKGILHFWVIISFSEELKSFQSCIKFHQSVILSRQVPFYQVTHAILTFSSSNWVINYLLFSLNTHKKANMDVSWHNCVAYYCLCSLLLQLTTVLTTVAYYCQGNSPKHMWWVGSQDSHKS